MSSALFADISSYQTVSDWQWYANWSRVGDGMPRVVMKATEGVGFKDSKFESFYSGAQAAGIEIVSVYHYARPDLNPGVSGAGNEARWFTSVLGSRILDVPCMLDFEQNESAAWAHAWHDAIAWPSGVKPVLYDSVSHFNQFFAGDLALAAKFDCALAAWYPLANGPPAAPPGWTMRWWQYADNETVPGIGVCDSNLWLGGASVVPEGWTDDGTTLTAPNGVTCNTGFRNFVLSNNWDPSNVPLAPDYHADPLTPARPSFGAGSRQDFSFNSVGWTATIGHEFFLPVGEEFAALKAQPPTGTAKLVIDEVSIRAVLA